MLGTSIRLHIMIEIVDYSRVDGIRYRLNFVNGSGQL